MFGYYRMVLDTSKTEEADRAQGFKEIDTASNIELTQIWYQYSMASLGPPTKPAFYYVAKKARELETKAGIAAAVAFFAAIGVAAISVSRKMARDQSP
jgi:hypothetical protein